MSDLVQYYRNLVPPNFGSEAPEKYGVMIFASKAKETADDIERLREALRGMDDATISHVDGRDLLDELHPRHTLDIKRRVDGIETWYEGDWLSRLRDARNIARAALGEGKE